MTQNIHRYTWKQQIKERSVWLQYAKLKKKKGNSLAEARVGDVRPYAYEYDPIFSPHLPPLPLP